MEYANKYILKKLTAWGRVLPK